MIHRMFSPHVVSIFNF